MEKIQITLAAARVNAGMTQEDIARRMKITKQTICNWEKGKSEPSLEQARALSRIYDMPLDNIFLPRKSNII